MSSQLVDSRPEGARQFSWLDGLVPALLMAQAACMTAAPRPSPGDTPGHYSYRHAPAGLDSPSATCRNSLSACAALHGTEVASATAVVKVVLEDTARKSIEEELAKCADLARSEVLLRYPNQFKGVGPDAEECKQETRDTTGRRVTWAMRLGIEMHEVARKCAEERLSRVRPGGFSLEQRYRPDLDTGRKELVSAETEKVLEASGNGGELKGTLKPDVVIHQGDPLNAQAVYDFKFPCVNTDRPPDWGRYPEGHPFKDETQKSVYQKYIAPFVARVLPRLGVVP